MTDYQTLTAEEIPPTDLIADKDFDYLLELAEADHRRKKEAGG